MDIRQSISRIPPRIWVLAGIMLVGVFVRTYRFHDWLYFYPDQARDVNLVGDVLLGKSSWPLLGPIAASTPFRLGPVTYYFQIASAAAFGFSPESLAYPDLLFGILAIPLLYVFLRRVLRERTALALTGLYSVSFYAIRYSRFAWNSNSIPFWSLLFLLSLSEFLHAKGRTAWPWIVALGISLGVGIQLHTVLLVLLPALSALSAAYSIRSERGVWKKWAAVIAIAFLLNAGQVASEAGTGFRNTRYFFSVLDDRSPHEGGGIVQNSALDLACHAQAYADFVTSLSASDDTCVTRASFVFGSSGFSDRTSYRLFLAAICFGFLLLVSGTVLLAYRLRNETDSRRRIVFGVSLSYGILTFLVMLPVVGHNGQVRYLLPVIALPFLFLGLWWDSLPALLPKAVRGLPFVLLAVLFAMNARTILSEARLHASMIRSDARYVVLDELEALRDAIVARSAPRKTAYVFGGQKYLQNYFAPLSYVASLEGFTIARGGRDIGNVPAGAPVFFIAQSRDIPQGSEYDARPEDLGLTPDGYVSVGNIGLYTVRR